MIHKLNYDTTDLIFRILFSLIFIGLGLEHLFQDELIRDLMPSWFGSKRLLSIAAGLILLSGGGAVLVGFKTIQGGILLGSFLVVVTLLIHVPALFITPADLPQDWHWLWSVYQKSNVVKNLCLLGVCFHLINHRPGKYSLDLWLSRKQG